MQIKSITKVTIFDYSEYVEEKSSNGGCYGFWTTYTRKGDVFEVSYGTTADFEYCSACGEFGCNGDECEYETVSEELMETVLTYFESTEDVWMEIEEKGESK